MATNARGDGEVPLIGLGASAGGVESLTHFVKRLPASLPAAVLVVLHISPAGTSVLDQILDRAGPLDAHTPADGERLRAGVVYVAPPDRHLAVEDGVVRLTSGPRENGHRPAIDVLFRSLAARGAGAIAIVLSGTRDDGTRGLLRVKAAGGTTLVQDPDEALYPQMIRSAMNNVELDGILPIDELAKQVTTLARSRSSMPSDDSAAAHEPAAIEGEKTRYTCPDCGGSLFRFDDHGIAHFDCSVGHRYSPESLDDEQGNTVESALWAATRLLGDRAVLLGELADRAQGYGHDRSASGFRQRADEASRAADVVRGLIMSGQVPTAGGDGTQE